VTNVQSGAGKVREKGKRVFSLCFPEIVGYFVDKGKVDTENDARKSLEEGENLSPETVLDRWTPG